MIIALGTRKQVGKDTVANYLKDQYGFKRIAFADPLKVEANSMLQAIGLEYTEANKEDFRPLLIALGELRRLFIPHYWVAKLMTVLNVERFNWPHWVVTDMRYPNEAEALRQIGGVIVRVNREHDLGDEPTEAVGDQIVPDYEVDNNGSLEDLHAQIDFIIKDWDQKQQVLAEKAQDEREAAEETL